MQAFFKKKKNTSKRPMVDRCPHRVKPRVGLYGAHNDEPLNCTAVEVYVEAAHDKSDFTITCTYVLDHTAADLYFPLSEFGRIIKARMLVQGKELEGGMYRRGADDGSLFPSGSPDFKDPNGPDAARAGAGDDDDDGGGRGAAGPSSIYYFVARDVGAQLAGTTGGKFAKRDVVRLVVEVSASNVRDPKEHTKWSIMFPFTAVPRAPQAFQYRVVMQQSIRTVFTPNRSANLVPFIRGRRAEVAVNVTPEQPMRTEDYLFILQVQLGEPIVPQCADPVSLVVLVSAVGLMIFFTLTGGLEDY
jgi:hypothetical protein